MDIRQERPVDWGRVLEGVSAVDKLAADEVLQFADIAGRCCRHLRVPDRPWAGLSKRIVFKDLEAFWGSAEGESSKRNGRVKDPPAIIVIGRAGLGAALRFQSVQQPFFTVL